MADIGVERVALAELRIDSRYQRQISPHRVKRLAGAWNDLAATVIVVSRRGSGALFIIDGQHRVAAAQKIGRDGLIAAVYTGLSVPEEAEMFTLINTARSAVPALVRFKARLAFMDSKAVRINAVVVAAGGRVSSGSVQPIAAVERVFDARGATVLKTVLEVLHEAFDGLTRESARATLIQALGILLSEKDRNYNRATLVATLRERSGPEWTAAASRAARHDGVYQPNVLAAMLREGYNRQLKARAKAQAESVA